MVKQESIFDQFYQEFLSLIDDDSRIKLEQLDRVIEPIAEKFGEEGWLVNRQCIMRRYENGVDVSCLDHHQDGFSIAAPLPTNMHPDYTKFVERRFVKQNQYPLLSLHLAMMLRDDILFNHKYSVKKPEDAAKVEDIHNLLGFQYPAVLPNFEEEIRGLGDKLSSELMYYFRLSDHFDQFDILYDEYLDLQEILKHNPVARKLDEYRYYSITGKMDEDLYKQVSLAYFNACRQVQMGTSTQKVKTE